MFQRNRPVIAIALGLLVSANGAAPAGADEIESKLKAVEQNLDQSRERQAKLDKAAKRAADELQKTKRRGVTLARALFDHSAKAGRLEARLSQLEAEERDKSATMARRKGQLAATLGALQRMARMPAATLVAIPQSPDDTIRSAILLRAAVPELQNEAAKLSEDLRTLTSLRAEITAEKLQLSETLEKLKVERRQLATLTADKLRLLKSMRQKERSIAEKTARLSAQAGSLRELLSKLSARKKNATLTKQDFEPRPGADTTPKTDEKRKTASLAPVTLSRDALPAPGRIITSFGDKLKNGTRSKGISIATRASAPVIAPHAGRIVFAGQFRGYGNLVILELPNRGHALISGMSRITAEIGDEVLVGEPLGEMTPSTTSKPELYFELRKRGRPINPLPQNAAPRNKVSG